jgi:hypothetical protein
MVPAGVEHPGPGATDVVGGDVVDGIVVAGGVVVVVVVEVLARLVVVGSAFEVDDLSAAG